MKDINTIITKNFNENISYIEQTHPQLFSKLSALDSAVSQGHYQEKYELVYENNSFDVFEKGTKNYLYNKDSLVHTLLAANSVNYKIDNNLFEGFSRHDISDDSLKKYADEEPFAADMSDIAPLIHYMQENSPQNKTLKTIDKFIFFGVGLGLHITAIQKKINSKVCFIVEDDLELFRLSLFTINYKDLASTATLIFSVFENNDEFMSSSALFLDTSYHYNHYLKYFSLLSHSEDKQNQFQLAVTSQPHIRFLFNNLLNIYLKPLEYLFDDYKILNNSLTFDTPYFNNKPFLVLAMGPSLQKNIKWLKSNHKRFITIAVSSSLSFLEREEISPNIILHLDPFEWGIISFDKVKSKEFTKNSLAFFSTGTPENIMSRFNKKQLFLFENGTDYRTSSLKLSTSCVGSLAYKLLLVLKAKNIFLLGLDLAVDDETGKTHSDSHQSTKNLGREESHIDNDSISYKDTLFKVAGNFKTTVLTTPNFYSSIFTIEYFTKFLKQNGQTVFNLSSGAKFTDTISLHANDINIQNDYPEIDVREYLHDFCEENSTVGFSKLELEELQKKLSHAKNLQKTLLNYQETENIDMYIAGIYSMLTSEEDINKYELSRVMETYLKYIVHYIFDFFNINELQNDANHIKNINALLKKHIMKILTFYIDALENKLN